MGNTANLLAGPQAVGVVLKSNRFVCAFRSNQIAAIFPGEVPTGAVVVTPRIAGCVIGDGLTIKSSQQILPVGIPIGMGMAESSACPR